MFLNLLMVKKQTIKVLRQKLNVSQSLNGDKQTIKVLR
jgi:hypothetical protein